MNEINSRTHTKYNSHLITHQMNTVRALGQFCLFYSFMKTKLHSISPTLLCSTDLSDLYLLLPIMSICYNTTMKNLSKDYSTSSLSYLKSILSNSKLLPTLSYYNNYQLLPDRVNTPYLQSLTVLHDFTNKLQF
jgi:hypothetical protein